MNYDVKVLLPAYDFIRNLPIKVRAKVYRGIDLLKLFGHQLGMPYSKVLRNAEGLKELRIKFGTDICRIFYFHFRDKQYVCTSGFIKKEDKTDEQEISRALKLRADFLRSFSNENT